MNKLTTHAKLLLLAIVTSALFAALGGTGIYQMRKLAEEISADLNAAKTENKILVAIEGAHVHFKVQVQEWKNILLRGNDAARFDKYVGQFAEQEKKVQDFLAEAIVVMKEQGIAVAELQQLQGHHKEMGDKYRAALKSFDKADPLSGHHVDELVAGMDRATGAGMEKAAMQMEQHSQERITIETQRAETSYQRASTLFTALTLLGLAVVITLSIVIQRGIMRVLGGDPAHAAAVTRRIASGDLSEAITTRSDDQSSLLNALKHMQASLHDVIGQIRDAAGRLADDATKMSAASHQVALGSNQQSDAAGSMAAAVEEMTASIRQVSSSADDARKMAVAAGTLSREGEGVVKGAVAEINKIADSFKRSSELIVNLREQSTKISVIVKVIKEIADQTNLLALNAAIEAARAGDQGRGFAVVADEVRKLAERTTVATQEVAGMIEAIQNGAESAMQGMSEGGVQLGEGVRMAAQAGVSMTDIEASSQSVQGAVSEISSALHEQSASSELIAQNVEKIAQMTDENTVAVKKVNDAARHLESLSGTLSALVGRFKV